MAISYLGVSGGTSVKSSGTTLQFASSGSVGDLLVLTIVMDNASASTPTFTVSDTKSNTWTQIANGFVGSAAASGVSCAIIVSLITTALSPITDLITVTNSTAVTARVAEAHRFTGASATVRGTAAVTSGTSSTPSVTTSSANVGDLVLGGVFYEDNTTLTISNADTDTVNGSWQWGASWATTGGGAASNVGYLFQFKETSGSTGTQTFNPTLPSSLDHVAIGVVLQPAGPPVVSRTASGTGTGTQTASRTAVRVRQATGTGTGTQTASRTRVPVRQATGNGSGTATTSFIRGRVRQATGTGTGTQSAARTVNRVRQATGTGTGSESTIFQRGLPRTATGSGLGTASSVHVRVVPRTATSVGQGSATAQGLLQVRRTATGIGTGSATTTSTSFHVVQRAATGTGTGTGTATPQIAVIVSRTASGSGTGSSSTVHTTTVRRSATGTSTSSQVCVGARTPQIQRQASGSGIGTSSTTIFRSHYRQATGTGTGTSETISYGTERPYPPSAPRNQGRVRSRQTTTVIAARPVIHMAMPPQRVQSVPQLVFDYEADDEIMLCLA